MLTYDEQGDVSGITKSVRLFSHRIVEEFMILANEVVARHLEENDVPSLYRVHEEPDPDEGSGLRGNRQRVRVATSSPRRREPAEFPEVHFLNRRTAGRADAVLSDAAFVQAGEDIRKKTSDISAWHPTLTRTSPHRSGVIPI